MAFSLGQAEILIATDSQRHGLAAECFAAGGAGAATSVAATANRAYYFPLYIDRHITVQKLWVLNGAAVSGNIDLGLYNSAGGLPTTKIISSGATVHANANVIQEVDITDTFLKGPAIYFFGIAADNGTSTFYTQSPGSVGVVRYMGIQQQASAYPLPSTATPATPSATLYIGGIACRLLAA